LPRIKEQKKTFSIIIITAEMCQLQEYKAIDNITNVGASKQQ